MAEIATGLLNLLAVFAVGVRIFTEIVVTIPYTVLLVFVGLGISLLGVTLPITLSHDLILFIFLPAILFQGAEEIDFQAYRTNLPISLPMVLIGLPVAVGLLGWSGTFVLGLPLLVSLLFAAMIYPPRTNQSAGKVEAVTVVGSDLPNYVTRSCS